MRGNKNWPSCDQLNDLLHLDPATGRLFWKPREPRHFKESSKVSSLDACRRWNAGFSGKEALTSINVHGYRAGRVLYHSLCAHTVIWAMTHGRWPEKEIDHINGDPLDNRPENLREATRSENEMNKLPGKRNSSGIKGVSWEKRRSKWRAQITANGEYKYLGSFGTRDEAESAYIAASIEMHGEFSIHRKQGGE